MAALKKSLQNNDFSALQKDEQFGYIIMAAKHALFLLDNRESNPVTQILERLINVTETFITRNYEKSRHLIEFNERVQAK